MLPFFLYLGTAIATGFHVYTLLSLAVYGAAFSPLELVSLLGSVLLLIAASVSLFRPQLAARIALIAALAIWCFYGPAIVNQIRGRSVKTHSVSQSIRQPHQGALARAQHQAESKAERP